MDMNKEPRRVKPIDIPQDEVDVRFGWLAENTKQEDMRLYDRLAVTAAQVGKVIINYSALRNPSFFLPHIFRPSHNRKD